MRELIPIRDYIVIEYKPKEGSLVILPSAEKVDDRDQDNYVVLFCGPDCKSVKPGDRLVINPEAVVRFKHEDKWYWLTREEAVGCIKREKEVVQ